jgi:hypothetical protein
MIVQTSTLRSSRLSCKAGESRSRPICVSSRVANVTSAMTGFSIARSGGTSRRYGAAAKRHIHRCSDHKLMDPRHDETQDRDC